MAKNYITINLNGQRVGLKFSSQSFADLNAKCDDFPIWTKTVINGKEQDAFTEIGIAHMLYSGYTNNCYMKGVKPIIDYSYFAEFVEDNFSSEQLRAENIMPAVNCWIAAFVDKAKTMNP